MKKLLKKAVFGLDRRLYVSGLRSRDELTLPTFLGLGPGQSASSWLAKHLSEHPEVFVTPVKETHYFSRNINDMSLRDYARLFRDGRGRFSGEITPGYSILTRERIALIRRLLPRVRLLITLRNPIERSWSAARRVMSKLGTTMEEITDEELFAYLRLEWSYRAANGASLEGDYEPGLLEGQYTRAITNWLEYFPEEQLLVLFFDDIRERPADVLARVCEHIGADPMFRWSDPEIRSPVNTNPAHSLPDRVRQFLETMYRPEIERLADRFGGPAKSWIETLNNRSHR